MVDRDDLSEDVERQIDTAMNEADLILFVVDIRDELMPLDEEVAQRLRYLKTPVILVMNKADYPEFDDRGRRVLQARPRQADRGLGPAEPQQEGSSCKLIEEMLPAGDDEQAGRRGDEDRRRRPAQHRASRRSSTPWPRPSG